MRLQIQEEDTERNMGVDMVIEEDLNMLVGRGIIGDDGGELIILEGEKDLKVEIYMNLNVSRGLRNAAGVVDVVNQNTYLVWFPFN